MLLAEKIPRAIKSVCQEMYSRLTTDSDGSQVGGQRLRLGARTTNIAVQISDEEKPPDNSRNDVAPFDHRANSHVAASEVLRNGSNDVVPDYFPDSPDVQRGQRMLVHERVHGGVDIRRRRRS
jgi:hypothetical protein